MVWTKANMEAVVMAVALSVFIGYNLWWVVKKCGGWLQSDAGGENFRWIVTFFGR